MRRGVVIAAAVALIGAAAMAPTPTPATEAAAMAPTPTPAAEGAAAPVLAPQLLHRVQFYGAGPSYGGDGWEPRRHRREWRQERDEARIADAARREAYRIEAEREQRRAWRRAQHGYGYGPAYGFGQHRTW